LLARRTLRVLLVGAAAIAALLPASTAQADPSPGQIEDQIERAGDQLEDVIEAYNGIGEQLGATQASITELAAKMTPLQEKMNAAEETVNQMAVAAYKGQSGLATMSALLSAGSSGTFVDRLTSLQQIARANQREVTEYGRLKTQYATERQRLDGLLAQQTGQRAELEKRKTAIEADLARLDSLKRRAQAAGRRPPPSAGNPGPPPSVSGRAGVAVQYAYAQLGKPYRWGAAGPNAFDCSGLTQQAWRAAGVGLPHNAAMQWKTVAHISRSQLSPGDLVFYRNLGHVAIYVGNGNVITAPTTGDVVKIAPVDRAASSLYGYGRPR
jgi:peptidoglycan DL-endopeptidase CwlO